MNAKRFKLLSMLSLSFLFVACTSESETAEENRENIETTESGESAQESANNETEAAEAQAEESAQNYSTEIDQEYLDHYEQVHNDILNNIAEGTYTSQDPFIQVNPYGTAPLTAIIAFETTEPLKAEVIVTGTTEETTVRKMFDETTTEFYLPVLGLYPNEQNSVHIQLYDEADNLVESNQFTLETDPLPDGFWHLELAVQSQEEKMEPGLTFLAPSRGNLFAVDSRGDVRYYIEPWMANTFTQLENGHMVLALRKEIDGDYKQLVEMDRLGRPHQAILLEIENYDRVNYFHHDLIEDQDENWLAAIHDGSGEYIEDEMALLDRETGEILESFNYRNIFPETFYEEYEGPGEDLGDWFHQNAMWFTDEGESLMASSRSQDSTIKHSYPEGDFEWILAAHEGWPEELQSYLLEPIGEVKFPGTQHAMMELPDQDGNEETIDILLFDNNRLANRGDESLEDEFSRGVHYQIDEENMTVEEKWSYGEERGEEFFSRIVGDADYLYETENVLLTSGRIEVDEENPESRIVEVTYEEEDDVVFEVIVSGFADWQGDRRQIYRAERMELYPE